MPTKMRSKFENELFSLPMPGSDVGNPFQEIWPRKNVPYGYCYKDDDDHDVGHHNQHRVSQDLARNTEDIGTGR